MGAPNAGHTPGPWRTVLSRNGSGDVGIKAPGLPNVLAECFADIRHEHEFAAGEAAANADFIVRAVNAHGDMLAALKLLVDTFDTLGDAPCENPPGSPWSKARAAIAAAEGRS